MTLAQGLAVEGARAKWVTGLLITGIVIDSIAVLSGFAQNSLLSRAAAGAGITEAAGTANDARQRIIGLFQVLAFSATAVCWLMWFHRAYGNLSLMGTKKADYTPGWAVGYWFVPVMNLFRPYQLMKEVWLRSKTRNALESIPTVPVVTLWWFVYILSGFLGSTEFRWSLRARDIAAFQDVTILGIISDGVGILAGALALVVVTRIHAFQRDADSIVTAPRSSGEASTA